MLRKALKIRSSLVVWMIMRSRHRLEASELNAQVSTPCL